MYVVIRRAPSMYVEQGCPSRAGNWPLTLGGRTGQAQEAAAGTGSSNPPTRASVCTSRRSPGTAHRGAGLPIGCGWPTRAHPAAR